MRSKNARLIVACVGILAGCRAAHDAEPSGLPATHRVSAATTPARAPGDPEQHVRLDLIGRWDIVGINGKRCDPAALPSEDPTEEARFLDGSFLVIEASSYKLLRGSHQMFEKPFRVIESTDATTTVDCGYGPSSRLVMKDRDTYELSFKGLSEKRLILRRHGA